MSGRASPGGVGSLHGGVRQAADRLQGLRGCCWLLACVACAGGGAPAAHPSRAAGSGVAGPASAASVVPSEHSGAPKPKSGTLPGGLARGNGGPADAQLLAGDQSLDRDDLPSARRAYEAAARLAPRDAAPLIGLVRVRLAELGVALEYATAPGDPKLVALLPEIDRALTLDRRFAPAHLERGRVLLLLGDGDGALASLGRAVELSPSDPEAHSALGVALLATGDVAGAVFRFRKASELDPDNPDRLTNLGTACMIRGRIDDAIQAFERAVALAPDDARAQGDLGTAYLAANQPEKARQHLERAVALAPRATFLSNLGYAQQLSGDLEGAIRTYRQALSQDDRLGSAWINLGTALARRGELDEAERCFRRALELDPSDPRAQANLEELAELRTQPAPAPSQVPGRGRP